MRRASLILHRSSGREKLSSMPAGGAAPAAAAAGAPAAAAEEKKGMCHLTFAIVAKPHNVLLFDLSWIQSF